MSWNANSAAVERHLFAAYGVDIEAVRGAFELLARKVSADPSLSDLVLFLGVKDNLKTAEAFQNLLSTDDRKALHGGGGLPVGPNATLRLETKRTIDRRSFADGVLAVYADDKRLVQAESIHGLRLLINVSWNPSLVKAWYQSSQPSLHKCPSLGQAPADQRTFLP